jgi:hypothetical protein
VVWIVVSRVHRAPTRLNPRELVSTFSNLNNRRPSAIQMNLPCPSSKRQPKILDIRFRPPSRNRARPFPSASGGAGMNQMAKARSQILVRPQSEGNSPPRQPRARVEVCALLCCGNLRAISRRDRAPASQTLRIPSSCFAPLRGDLGLKLEPWSGFGIWNSELWTLQRPQQGSRS